MGDRLARIAVSLFTAAVIVALALADGGFFRWTWPWTILALAAATAGALVLRGRPEIGRLELAFVAGLAVLAGWQALSAEWSQDPARSLEDAYRGAVYVAAAATFVVLVRLAGARAVLAGVAGGAAGALAYGLLEYALSDRPDRFQGDLLFQPLGYANAVGILAALALVLAVQLRPRAAIAAVAVVSIAVLALSESRASWAAAAVGFATAAVCRWRPHWLRPWLGLLALLVVLVLVSPLFTEPGRLYGLLSGRSYYWPAAWHSLGSPLHGIGSGGFAQLWALERPEASVPLNAIDAHSLFLETLLELGAIGLVVVAVTLVLPLVAAPRAGMAAATGAYVAFLVHAAGDWDWEMPVVTIAGLACGVALLSGRRMEL